MSLLVILAVLTLGALVLIIAAPVPSPAMSRDPVGGQAVSSSRGALTAPGHRQRSRHRAVMPSDLDLAHLIERLATVVASGIAPRRAWTAVAEASDPGVLQDLSRAVGAGADPRVVAPAALAHSGQIRALGAALDLCERTGAPTGPVLMTLADALRDVADAQAARRSAFAGPLATARILLALPLAGLGLGMLLGADPLGVLLHGSGLGLLAAGTALTAAGWWWMHRLIRSAQGTEAHGVDPSIVLDLVAGPLASGSPLARSMQAVGACLGEDPSARQLGDAGTALAAGAPAAVALRALPAALAPLREAAMVGESTGADLAGLLRSCGRDARRGRARDAEAAAARLGVRLVLPTGTTLLPAFVLLGILPTVASLLGGSLGGLTS